MQNGTPEIDEPSYPAVRFLLRHGAALSLLLAFVLALAGILLAVTSGAWWPVIAGAAAGALAWLLLRSYCEMLRIVTDTLLPQ